MPEIKLTARAERIVHHAQRRAVLGGRDEPDLFDLLQAACEDASSLVALVFQDAGIDVASWQREDGSVGLGYSALAPALDEQRVVLGVNYVGVEVLFLVLLAVPDPNIDALLQTCGRDRIQLQTTVLDIFGMERVGYRAVPSE